MKKIFILCFLSTHLWAATQTIVMLRHGEKQTNKSGVLSCQGLNRSLALPDVLKRYGSPQALFAAAPKQHKLGNSVRSVQTILPIATTYSLPINLNFHAKDVIGMKNALLDNTLEDSLIFVVWQHDYLVKIAREVYKERGGNPTEIPDWTHNDFDSLYIIEYESSGTVNFKKEAQNLNQLSTNCPQ